MKIIPIYLNSNRNNIVSKYPEIVIIRGKHLKIRGKISGFAANFMANIKKKVSANCDQQISHTKKKIPDHRYGRILNFYIILQKYIKRKKIHKPKGYADSDFSPQI